MRIKEKHLIIANFKMYLSGKGQVSQWLRNFDRDSKNLELIESRLVLCPPAVSLADFASNIELDCVSFGAQDCFWQDEGAYTSGLGSKMVSSYGGKFVILGHSERRKYFGETDEAVSHKTSLAVKNRLHPILLRRRKRRREETGGDQRSASQ